MPLDLEKHLVLNKFLLHQFGYDEFDKLREDFSNIAIGYDDTGRSYIVNRLIGNNLQVNEHELLRYDEVIKEYEERLRKNRNEINLNLKYFQYFAVLFTEYYFDCLSNNKQAFLEAINAFSVDYCAKANISVLVFLEQDLKKLAFWMATGSGKTLLMHINYWQSLKYFPDWDNIILITPNEGLSKQHYEEYLLSGLPAKQYKGSEESLKTKDNEILIIEITKLTEEKTGEGLSIDISFFSESNNLVFIDEGHKGQSSFEQSWKKKREALSENGFTFEYSATFGQVINQARTVLLEEYSKSILFDYSYKYFYSDGYGKDFFTYNLKEGDYSDEQRSLLLTASLLNYYEQIVLFEKFPELCKEYNIQKPLWIFVGSKVIGKKKLTKDGEKSISDVIEITKYLNTMISNPSKLDLNILLILEDKSGLINNEGSDIFQGKFEYLRKNKPTAEQIYNKIFNGTGTLELYENKSSDGEIALKLSLASNYFGVINIGDVSALKKKMHEEGIEVKSENIKSSQFDSINESNSTINLLIGSKKFIEGWNSWRVSNMGLMNIGRSEGTQIIQLFGRGIRLKGKALSLKREEQAQPELKTLQTLSIFGLNAEYIVTFLDNIGQEIEPPKEFEVPIMFNEQSKWENKIFAFRKDINYNFKDELVVLKNKNSIASRISLNLNSKITVTSGFASDSVRVDEDENINPLTNSVYSKFIIWDNIILSLNVYKLARGYSNLIIEKDVLKQIIASDKYKLYLSASQLPKDFSIKFKIQQIAELILKDYLNKFYSDSEKDYLTKNLKVEYLNTNDHKDVFPEDNKIIIKVPKQYVSEVDLLIKDMNKFYTQNIDRIPTIHFDRHLYSPLATYKKGSKFEEIKTVPVKLNEGETKFIQHLKEYLVSEASKLNDIEIFILRNISKKGVGFFLETSSFYPDFIIWIKKPGKQEVLFIDPKGILMLGNVNDEKIKFCTDTVKEIEKALRKKLDEIPDTTVLNLYGYILSVTAFDTVKLKFQDGKMTKQDFENNNILFLENDKKYMSKIFAGKW